MTLEPNRPSSHPRIVGAERIDESGSEDVEREAELYISNEYDEEELQQRQWNRRMFDVKLDFLDTFSQIGRVSALIAFAIVIYLTLMVLVHYTGPKFLRWLNDGELIRLESFYSRAAAVAVPGMLMGNAWLIWMASRRPNR